MQKLVLVGGGHAHLFVLEALARRPRPDLSITLISPSRWQYYSGMLPGWMAGHYPLEACRLDLRALAQQAGISFIEDTLIGMDANKRCACLSGGRHLHYDAVSLDTGSETDVAWLADLGERLLPVKPLSRFMASWPEILAQAGTQANFHLVVAGGGAGGVELALAAAQALAAQGWGARTTIVTGDSGLLPGHDTKARQHAAAALQAHDIPVIPQRAAGVPEGLLLKDGSLLSAARVLAATGARAPVWLALSGLRLDAAGYIAVNAQHRSESHPEVFAAGDVCARSDVRLVRSGVQAVRAGPVLAHNLFAMLDGQPLKTYRPRRNSLYLLASGQRRAIASWGRFSAEGHWVWRWKDWIDRRFIARFSKTPRLAGVSLQTRMPK